MITIYRLRHICSFSMFEITEQLLFYVEPFEAKNFEYLLFGNACCILYSEYEWSSSLFIHIILVNQNFVLAKYPASKSKRWQTFIHKTIIAIIIECAKLRLFWWRLFFLYLFSSNYYYYYCYCRYGKNMCHNTKWRGKNLTYSYHKFNFRIFSVPVNSLLILKQINRYSLMGASEWASGWIASTWKIFERW